MMECMRQIVPIVRRLWRTVCRVVVSTPAGVLLWLLGACAGLAVRAVWWMLAAVAVGYEDGRGSGGGRE